MKKIKSKIAMFNLNRKSTFRSTLLALMLALMLALLLGGAGFLGSPAAAQEPQYGGSITFLDGYGAQWPPTGWDPAIGIWTVQNWVEPYLETLLAADYEKYGPRGTNEAPFQISQGNPLTMLKGRLAESWSLPDANTIIYKIRQGIMWGEVPGVMKSRELAAQDVVSSLLRNMNEEIARNGFGARYYKVMESMTAKDRYTIEIKLENFIADWWLFYGYAVWAGAGIIPPELLTAGSNDWKNHRGIGTGPFFLEDYVEGSHIEYVKNPNYWDSPITINGKEYKVPFLDGFRKTLIQDKSTQIAALRTGKIDVMDNVQNKYLQSLKTSSPQIKYLGKVEERAWRIGMRQDRKPFADIKVRKALAMAIDRQAVTNTVWGGEAKTLNAEVHSSMGEAYFTELEDLPQSTQECFSYNPDRAKLLLAEAGFPNGFESTLQTFAGEPFEDLAALLQAFWKDIGVGVKIDVRESTALEGILSANDHEPITLIVYSSGLPFLTLSGLFNPDSHYNVNEVDLPELKALYEQAEKTIGVDEQAKLLKELNQKWHAGCHFAYLPTPLVSLAIWPWVENYYGEVNDTATFTVGHIFSRAWLNSDLKKEILGQ